MCKLRRDIFCFAVLPFLERTTFFLYPIGAVIVLSPICKC